MSVERVAHTDPWIGCVVGTETGVAVVLTDRGEIRASYGGGLLARIARDRSRAPIAGTWVVLRAWSDGRITIEDTWSRTEPVARERRTSVVVPLRRPH